MKERKILIIGSIITLIISLAVLSFFPVWSTSAQEKSIKTLKLGATSNFGDRQGIQVKKCLELLAEQLNKAGGLLVKGEKYHAEMIVYDDKFQAVAGRAAFERLVYEDKVKAIFSYGSAPVLAGLEVTEPNKVLLFNGAFAPQVMLPKYKYSLRTRANTVGFASSAVFWKKHLKPTIKTAVIVANDDQTGHAIAKVVGAAWKNCGLTILDNLYFKRGTADLNPVGAKLKSLNPDIVEFAGIMSGAETLRLFKAVYQSGWKGQISAELAQTTVPDIVNALGKQAAEEMIVMIIDPTVIPNPPFLAGPFRKAYIEKYGEWEIDGLRWIDGWFYFIEAVKKADSLDPDAIVDAMQGLSVETIFGDSRMCRRPDLGNNRYVDCSTTKFFGQVKNGEVVYLDRVAAIEGIRMAEKIFDKGKWE
jgi:branched-chain amino acid transport system substrate-binding protein